MIAALVAWALVDPAVAADAPVPERGRLALRAAAPDRSNGRLGGRPLHEFSGVLGQRIDANVRNWLLVAPDANPGMIEMFRVRDRQPTPQLVPWAGEFVGKYLLSAVQTLRLVRSDELDRTVRRIVDELIATQAEDGYLGPFPKEQRLAGNWDLWGHYHVMQALLTYHEDSGYRPALDAATRAADLICKMYLDTGRRVFDADSHEMNMAVIHVLARLYRKTGHQRYWRMVQEIEKDWERAGDYLRTGLAGVEFYQTPRPRWESLHDLQGLVELYRVTGDERYKTAFVHHWKSIRTHDQHNTGGFSTGEAAIGNPYQPGAIETCCVVAWVALSVDMLQVTGDPAAADELEWSTVNAILGAQHPSGRWWTYDTPMDGTRAASAHSIVFQARPGTPELNCCSVNGPRGLGMLSDWAVLVDDAGLVVNYYGPGRLGCRVAGENELTITQETAYPADGVVTLKLALTRPAKLELRLRVPAWSKATTIVVNAQTGASPARLGSDVKPGTYLSLPREWQTGDTIRLELDMTPWVWAGERDVAGRASVFRGPLLLAFDQHYNVLDCGQIPAVDPERLSLRPVASAAERFAPIVLCELPAADGTLLRLCDFASAGAYGTEYRTWLPVRSASPATP